MPRRAKPRPLGTACPHPAGSAEKLAALRRRIARREQLWHPDDSQQITGGAKCTTHSDALLDAMRLFAPIATDALAATR